MTGGFDLADILRPFVQMAADAVADRLHADHLLRTDGRAPPPRDEDTEDRVFWMLLTASVDDRLPSVTPDLFFGRYKQIAATALRCALDRGAPLTTDAAFADLCRAWPQLQKTWRGLLERIENDTPAVAPKRLPDDIARLRLLADVRDLLRGMDELDCDARPGLLTREQIHVALVRLAAPFEPKGQL